MKKSSANKNTYHRFVSMIGVFSVFKRGNRAVPDHGNDRRRLRQISKDKSDIGYEKWEPDRKTPRKRIVYANLNT